MVLETPEGGQCLRAAFKSADEPLPKVCRPDVDSQIALVQERSRKKNGSVVRVPERTFSSLKAKKKIRKVSIKNIFKGF